MNFEFCMSLASLKVRLEALGNLGISLVALRAVRTQSQIDSIEKVIAQSQVDWIRDSLASECSRLRDELQMATHDLFDLLEKDRAQFEHDQNVWAFWKDHSEALRLVDAFSSELDPAWFQPIVVHLETRYAQLVADQTHLHPEPKHAHKHTKRETRERNKSKAQRAVSPDERKSKPRRFDRHQDRYSKRPDVVPAKQEDRRHLLPAPSDALRRQEESAHTPSRAKSATRPAPTQEKKSRSAHSRYVYESDLHDSIEDSFASDPYATSAAEREKLRARLGLDRTGKRVVHEADTYDVLENLYPDDEGSQQDDEGSQQDDEGSQQDDEGSQQDDEGSQQDDEGSQQDDEGSQQDDEGQEEHQDARRHLAARPMDRRSQDGSMPELEEEEAPASPRSVVSLEGLGEGALTRDEQKAIVLKGKADALLSSQATRSGFR
jgi:hypothetical protein